MSNSKRSWESVYDFAKRNMRKDAPLSFNEPHITMLANMMMEITNQQQISIVRTGLPLPEPIVSRHGSHFVSWSMIAMIINAPYKREPVPIEISERPDPFQAVLKEMRKRDKRQPQLSTSKKRSKRANKQGNEDSDSSHSSEADQDVVHSERGLYFEQFLSPLERQKHMWTRRLKVYVCYTHFDWRSLSFIGTNILLIKFPTQINVTRTKDSAVSSTQIRSVVGSQ